MRAAVVLASVLAFAAFASAGAAGDGGPSPGWLWGGAGISSPDGTVHYVTVTGRTDTVVEALDRHGTVLHFGWLPGFYGVPFVASDGQVGGLTRDGRRLVVAGYPGIDAKTHFVVLKTGSFAIARRIALPGNWSFDALSPDGRTLYLIQYLIGPASTRYLVRAYDLVRGRLYRPPVADRIERGPMTGSPVTRVTSADGAWAYTLYVRGDGSTFVHALDTARRKAVCVDLPWRKAAPWVYRVNMRVARGRLVLHELHGTRTAVVDTRSWHVTT
jgi:hypothetical protein